MLEENKKIVFWVSLIALIGMCEFLPIPVSMAALLSVFVTALFLLLFSKKSLPLIWLLLPVFYFFPYENINPLVRETGDYFSIYKRIIGPLNIWELFIGFTFIAFIVQKLKSGKFNLQGFSNLSWFGILSVFLFAFVMGLLHVRGNLLSYGHTDILRPFVASQAILYMVVFYFLTINTIRSQRDVRHTIWLVKYLSILLILYGILRGILILTGKLTTIWPFGLPIVLYNQMIMLYLIVFWGWIDFFVTKKEKSISNFWVLFAVLLILISTRRFNYFILIAGSLLAIVAAKNFSHLSAKNFVKKMLVPVTVFAAFLVLFMIVFPTYLESVTSSLRSLNIYNLNDAGTNNDIRRAAMENLFLNLSHRPYTFFTGFGLGTTWQAVVYQPFDTLFRSVNSDFMMKSMGWYPQFPLPYINLIFRYGILGVVTFWTLCVWLALGFYRRLKRIDLSGLPVGYYIGTLIFVLLFLSSFGDIYNPTAPILVGFLIGLLERTFHLFSVREAK